MSNANSIPLLIAKFEEMSLAEQLMAKPNETAEEVAQIAGEDIDTVKSLFKAAEGDHWHAIQFLVKALDFQTHNESAESSKRIFVVDKFGALDAIKQFIESSAVGVSYKLDNGCMFSYVADCKDSFKVIDFLLTESVYSASLQKSEGNALHYAAASGNLDIIRCLIDEHDFDVNSKTNDATTPLMIAAKFGHLEVVQYFVESKHVSIQNKNSNRYTALHMSAANGHLNVVEYLVKQPKQNFNAQTKEGATPLLLAAKSGSLKTVKVLLQRGAFIRHEDKNYKNVLHYAVDSGKLDVLKYLIEEHKVGHDCDRYGNTPLLRAAAEGQLEAVKYFVEVKCFSVDKKALNGYNAMHMAIVYGRSNVVEYLAKRPNPNLLTPTLRGATPLLLAAGIGNLKVLTLLLDCGAKIQDEDGTGKNALHYAAQSGKVDVIQYLIQEHDFDMLKRDRDGKTPCLIAAIEGHLEAVKYFVESNKACTDVTRDDGYTILHFVAPKGNLKMIYYLINQTNLNLNVTTIYGTTPLHLAAASGSLETFEFLCANGANIAAQDVSGKNALHYAAEGNNLDIIRWLIDEHNFDFECRAGNGETPLIKATQFGHQKAVDYFVKLSKSKQGNNALIIEAVEHALRRNNFAVAQQLFEMYGESLAPAAAESLLWLAAKAYYPGEWDSHFKFIISLLEAEIVVDEGMAGEKTTTSIINATTDEMKITLLGNAAGTNNLEMLQYLIDAKNFNINLFNKTTDEDSGRNFEAAARIGHFDIVRYVLEHDNLSVLNKRRIGLTALRCAAAGGQLPIVKYLISKHNVDLKTALTHDSVLRETITGGDVDTLKFLLHYGANLATIKYKSACLKIVAENGHLGMLTYLLEEHNFGAGEIDQPTVENPLYAAVVKGHLDVVKYLAEKRKMSKDQRFEHNNMLLYAAAVNVRTSIVKYFIEAQDIDVNTKGHADSKPLLLSSRREVVELLLQNGADISVKDNQQNTLLYHAIKAKNMPLVKWLIEQPGFDINTINKIGSNMLFAAVSGGSIGMIKYLIEEQHIDAHITNIYGYTLLHEAAIFARSDVVKYLVEEQKIDINAKCINGTTALLSSAGSNCPPSVLKYLLAAGADLSVVDNEHNNVLHYAAAGNDISKLKILMQNKNLCINKKNMFDLSPFFLADRMGAEWSVKYFVEDLKINVHDHNTRKQTVLYEAIRGGNLGIVKYLVEEHGANLQTQDISGLTPLQFAEERMQDEIFNYILLQEKSAPREPRALSLVDCARRIKKKYFKNKYK